MKNFPFPVFYIVIKLGLVTTSLANDAAIDWFALNRIWCCYQGQANGADWRDYALLFPKERIDKEGRSPVRGRDPRKDLLFRCTERAL